MANAMRKICCFIFILSIFPCSLIWADEDDNKVITYRQVQAPVICIDQINKDDIIINDTLFKRFDGTMYFDVDGKRVDGSQFKVGTCVKVVMGEDHLLLSLYEAVGEKRSDNPDVVSPDLVNDLGQGDTSRVNDKAAAGVNKKSMIRKEGDVWKN